VAKPGRDWLLVCLALIPLLANADTTWSGYAKNLAVGSHSMVDGDRYWSDLTRLRLSTRSRWDTVELVLDQDLEFLTGSFLDTPDYAVIDAAPDPRYWHAQSVFQRSSDLVGRYQLYRGTLRWQSPLGDFRVGRQQVNWATGLIWSPMDILNPASPFQLEPDERIGVDALLWDHPWGTLGRVSAVYAPAHPSGQQTTALRVKRFVAGIDASIMAGEFSTTQAYGLSGAGNLGDAGWHGEAVWHKPDVGERYWQWVAGLTWASANGLDLGVEGFYNGHKVDTPLLDISRLVGGIPSYRGGGYLGATASQDLTPFLHYRVVAVLNLDDNSGAFYPRLTWSLPSRQEIYLTFGLQAFWGGTGSEYGSLENLVLGELLWFY